MWIRRPEGKRRKRYELKQTKEGGKNQCRGCKNTNLFHLLDTDDIFTMYLIKYTEILYNTNGSRFVCRNSLMTKHKEK